MSMNKNNRILIVDDSQGIHNDFRKVLGACKSEEDDLDWIKAEMLGEVVEKDTEAHFEVDSAFQGVEGLSKVLNAVESGRPYALAFVDIRMPPGWDGVETIEHLWQVDPDLEVVICSAYSDYGWDQIVSRLGKTDRLLVLKKPFESVEVIQIAHALTEKWALQHAARLRTDELAGLVKERTQELEVSNARLAKEMKERQEMEAELRLAQKLEAIGQLAAGIAHEINTPMQYISDNTHFLKTAFQHVMQVVDAYQKVVDTAGKGECTAHVVDAKAIATRAKLDFLRKRVPRALETTIEGVGNVSRIVSAMKNFSHVGTEEMTPTDLNSAIEATVTVSKNEWKYVAEVDTDLDPTLPLVLCLAGELNQVVLNIIVNAAHAIEGTIDQASGEKGRISIRTKAVSGVAEISITDTGGGVPESVQNRIFDPFFTTKEVGRGSGQGLAIARSIVVDKHGGTLSFDSTSGEGTTFHIRLPFNAADSEFGDAA